MEPLRSQTTFSGRKMAGARALWRANGMKESFFGKPVIAVVNSFSQFVPGHTHLHRTGQMVKKEIERLGCFAAEFNTIAIDDGIAMGHEGMLYSLPSRDLIADSVEYMCNAHCVDAMICISNCDKITPGMLMAAMRLNIPAVFVSGGPMEAGHIDGKDYDLIDIMVRGADPAVSDNELEKLEKMGCPTCGCCSGMFTANSMNCLTEALGLAPVGNGTILATHNFRKNLFIQGARLIVRLTDEYYNKGNRNVLPRSIATKEAFENAMMLDMAMGGSTNSILHLLAIVHEAGVDFNLKDIDRLSRFIPVLCKVAPNSRYHIQDVNRAGGVMGIMSELAKGGYLHSRALRIDYPTLGQAIDDHNFRNKQADARKVAKYLAAPCNIRNLSMGKNKTLYDSYDADRSGGCIRDIEHAYAPDGGLAVLYGNLAPGGCVVKTAGVRKEMMRFTGKAVVFESQEEAVEGILGGKVSKGDVVVIRYEGPRGGPGMQEMLYPTSYLKSMQLDSHCALLTDGRFSGGTSGLSVGHVSPEAAGKGAIALVRDGDEITFDIAHRSIEVALSPGQLSERRKALEGPGGSGYRPLHRNRTVSKALQAYALFAGSADMGGIRIINQSEEQ